MDEEEELENTLIGQQEEAPAVDTGDALIGAGEVDLTGQVNFQDYDVPEPPRTADLSAFTLGGDLKPGIDVNAITPSPTTLPEPSAVNTALNQEVPVGSPENNEPSFFSRLGDFFFPYGVGGENRPTTGPFRSLERFPNDPGVENSGSFGTTQPSTATAQSFFGEAPASNAAEAAQRLIDAGPAVTKEPTPAIPEGAPGSPQANFAERMATGEPLTSQEIQDAQAFAASMGTTFDPATGYSRKAFEDAQAGAPRSDLFPNDPGVQRTRDELMRRFGAPTIREIQEQDAMRRFGGGATPAPAAVNNFAPQAPSGQAGPAKVSDEIMSQIARPAPQTMEFRDSNGDGVEDRQQGIFRPGELLGYDAQGNEVRSPGTQQPVNRGVVRDALFRGPPQQRAVPLFRTGPNVDPGFIQQPSLRDPDKGFSPRPPSLRDPDAGFSPRPLPNDPTTTGPGNVRDFFNRNPVPNLSDFERKGLAREARLDARPDFNEVRRDSDRRGGISQADARDLAQGMAKDATEGERMRALQIQSRLGLGDFEPEKELTDLEKREIESRISAREEDIAASGRKADFKPRLIDVGGERAIELSPGYFQRIPKDTPNKTGLQKTLENLQADLDSGRLTQEEYDIASKNAKAVYIGREKPKGQTTEDEFQNIIAGAAAGDTPQVTTDSGFTPKQEADIQKVLAANPDKTRAEVIEAMDKAGKL